MKVILFLFFFIGSISTQVVTLTPDNFDEVVDGSHHVLVEFYAPWCGHCKKLEPEYTQVGEAFAKEKEVVIAKVDADNHKDLGSRFDIHGFPTIKFFPKGSTEGKPYESGRTAEDIIAWINREAGTRVVLKKAPSSVVVLTDENFEKIVMDEKKHILVEFYAPWCGHCKALAPEYEKVATAFSGEEDVVIAKYDADSQKTFSSKYGISGFPTLKWFSKDDKENPKDYASGRDLKSFVEFINENAGTNRNPDGSLAETAGRISALDELAKRFYDAPKEERNKIIAQTKEEIKKLEGLEAKNGENYAKIMEIIQKKGKDFVDKEKARISRMLEGSLTRKKADELTIRHNILSAFSE